MKNRVEEIFEKSTSAEQYFEEYCRYVGELLSNLDFAAIARVAQLILEKSRSGQTIFLAGNGGSAATASHFAVDLSFCSPPGAGPRFRAISLADSNPLITALANDIEYKEIFTGQMRNLFREGDVLIAISASGNSPNVVAAARLAKEMGGVCIGLVGFDGGELGKICDHVINVVTRKGEYGPVEDIHMALDHMITTYLRSELGNPQPVR